MAPEMWARAPGASVGMKIHISNKLLTTDDFYEAIRHGNTED